MKSPIEELRMRVANGMSQADSIEAMQSFGLPIIEAIKMTRELFCLSLGAAKKLVEAHPAYSQIAGASRPLQDEVLRVFQEIGEMGEEQD